MLTDVDFAGHLSVGNVAVVAVAIAVLTCVFNYVTSYIGYYAAISQQLSPNHKNAYRPAHLPYSLPFFGSAFTFLTRKPGAFWEWLMAKHPQQTGACTVLLGGKTMHLLFAPPAVQAILKARTTERVKFDIEVMSNGYGADMKDLHKFFYYKAPKDGWTTDKLQDMFLMSKSSVTELTRTYVSFLDKMLGAEEELEADGTIETDLYFGFVRKIAFAASTDAFFGTRLRETMPTLEHDFYTFDHDFLKMFFGFPRFLSPEIYKVRDRLIGEWTQLAKTMLKENNDTIPDPQTIEWEPNFGSRLNRGRQQLYREVGVSLDGAIRFNLGFLFASSSNAIPAAAWMLFHLLDPNTPDKTLLPDVMAEIQTAILPDGSLDIPKLVELPLLVSIVWEILRLYVDILVMRELNEDIALPLDEDGKRQLTLRKGEFAFVPTYMTHRSELYWGSDPTATFNGRRFLKTDADGKQVFTTSLADGALLPFGGGKWICPGRVFVKQELLVTIAILLTRYDFKVLGYRKDGEEADAFPPFASVFPGSALVAPGGDFRVQIKKKVRA